MEIVYYNNDWDKLIEAEVATVKESPASMIDRGYGDRQELFSTMLTIMANHLHSHKAEVEAAIKKLDIVGGLNQPSQKKPFKKLIDVFVTDEYCRDELMNAYEQKLNSSHIFHNDDFMQQSRHTLLAKANKQLVKDGFLDNNTPMYVVSIDNNENPSCVSCKEFIISSIEDITKDYPDTNDYCSLKIYRDSDTHMWFMVTAYWDSTETETYFIVPKKYVESIPKENVIRKIIDFFTTNFI